MGWEEQKEQKFKIERNINHSYCILENVKMDADFFEIRMLERAKIEGVLPFSIRFDNGMQQAVFDISGKTSLSDMYREKKISASLIFGLIDALEKLLRNIENHMLSLESILLSESTVYLSENEFFFTYIPQEKFNLAKDINKLMYYILNHIDHKDDETVLLAYGLFQESSSSDFEFGDLIRLVQKRKERNWKEESGLEEVIEIDLIAPELDEKEDQEEFDPTAMYKLIENEIQKEDEIEEPDKRNKEFWIKKIGIAVAVVLGVPIFLWLFKGSAFIRTYIPLCLILDIVTIAFFALDFINKTVKD